MGVGFRLDVLQIVCGAGICLAACVVPAVAAAAVLAEYAVRWDPAQGGLSTGQEVLAVLNLNSSDIDTYSVRYFTVNVRTDAPAGFATIVRSRQKGNKTDLTVKYRGLGDAPALPRLQHWVCALGSNAEKKDEVDVSIVQGLAAKRVFSRSCTLESSGAPSFPEFLGARESGCESTMTRHKAGAVKVEVWTFRGSDARLLEVSKVGPDSPDELRRFLDAVVKPLVDKHVAPVDRSKSEAGGDCR